MKTFISLIKKWMTFCLLGFFVLHIFSCEIINRSTTTSNPVKEIPSDFSAVGSFQQVQVALRKLNPFLLNFLFPSAQASSPVILDASGRMVVITRAWIAFSQVELKYTQFTDGTDGAIGDLVYPGPFYVNLLSSTPAIIDTQFLRQLNYNRILVSLHKQDDIPAGVPAELIGHSIFLEGTVNGIALTFKSSETSGLQVSGPNSIFPTGQGAFLLEFHIGRIIKKINLSSISSATEISNSYKYAISNPCPAIDPGASDIYTCFKVGLETESNLGIDLDGDFQLGDTEATLK